MATRVKISLPPPALGRASPLFIAVPDAPLVKKVGLYTLESGLVLRARVRPRSLLVVVSEKLARRTPGVRWITNHGVVGLVFD